MVVDLVNKLLDSFSELERCVDVTRDVLRTRDDVSPDVLCRINSYSEMVAKQRKLALELEVLIAEQNWDQVNRYVRLINGYSHMIRQDAQEILAYAMGSLPSLGEDKSEKLLA
ncbi:MAG: hypothetical protein IT290_04150 [Deltaproteobacteria bacterium]|nr:hypothetical protein [Deltaproteobacteria bacterium]